MGQAAMEDADELVGELAACGLGGVGSGVMGVVVGPRPRGCPDSDRRPPRSSGSKSRLLRTKRAITTWLVPEARVIGAVPA